MIKLQQLAHALALRRYGNFRRAAAALHLSQPALSRSIRTLEEALGVALFERAGVVGPTLYGEALLRRAEAILNETEELEREIGLLQGVDAGSFAVAMGAYAAEISGRQAVGELVKRHPNLACQVSHDRWTQVSARVLAREVDLGFAEISTLRDAERLTIEPIGRHGLVYFCRRGHPLLGRGVVSRADIDPYLLALIRVAPRAASQVPGKASIDRDTGDLIPHVDVDDLATARAVVLASDALSLAPPVQIEPWVNRGEFAILPFSAPWMHLDYGFIRLTNRMPSPAAERFMAIVREIEAVQDIRNRELIKEHIAGPTVQAAQLA